MVALLAGACSSDSEPTAGATPVAAILSSTTQGVGGRNLTEEFDAPEGWTLHWSFECSDGNDGGPFRLGLRGSPSDPAAEMPEAVERTGTEGSGTLGPLPAGRFRMDLESACPAEAVAREPA